jgi:hypothetical protein
MSTSGFQLSRLAPALLPDRCYLVSELKISNSSAHHQHGAELEHTALSQRLLYHATVRQYDHLFASSDTPARRGAEKARASTSTQAQELSLHQQRCRVGSLVEVFRPRGDFHQFPRPAMAGQEGSTHQISRESANPSTAW